MTTGCTIRPPDEETTSTRYYWRRPGDGVTAFGLGPEQAARILAWLEKATARRQATGRPRGDGAKTPAPSSSRRIRISAQVLGQNAEQGGYLAAERLDPFESEGVRFSLILAALPVRSRR